MKNLKGKTALITGGSRGLGRATAHSLAQSGANVILTYVQNEAKAGDVVNELAGVGVKAHALQVDLTGTANLDVFVTRFRTVLSDWNLDRFDILVNNAGVSSNASAHELTEAELDRQYNTNFKSLVFLTQKLVPIMNDGGRIITMGTGLTRVAFSPMVAYAAIKSAVETFTRYLAQDLGKRSITVNSLSPGAIDNDFNRQRFEETPAIKDYIAANTALGRVGAPEDVGGVAAFLCSDDARWITGQRLEVSGGMKL